MMLIKCILHSKYMLHLYSETNNLDIYIYLETVSCNLPKVINTDSNLYIFNLILVIKKFKIQKEPKIPTTILNYGNLFK